MPEGVSLAPRLQKVSKIIRATLPGKNPSSLWTVLVSDGIVTGIEPHNELETVHEASVLDARQRLVAPPLCHAHVHLDKCYLLQDEKYADLEIVKGDFAEAMSLTGRAKQRFEADDLIRRGRRLIVESIEHGVTAMRAYVEVDEISRMKCIDAGLDLRNEFASSCQVQICAFAQLAIFSGEDGGKGRRDMILQALEKSGVDALGSTPYVEETGEAMRENVQWTIEMALKWGKHLDFHLDYNVDAATEPLVWFVIDELKRRRWTQRARAGQVICLGHCTRLSLLDDAEWRRLAEEIGQLPVSFVGLPTSDLFMMGRPVGEWGEAGQRVRGTLQIPMMIKDYGLQAAIALNNIGNAFTPYGSTDPLSVASLGVGVYQAGTKRDAGLLYECVSTGARQAIGLGASSAEPKVGQRADFVLFGWHRAWQEHPRSVAEVVYCPPSWREAVYNGSTAKMLVGAG